MSIDEKMVFSIFARIYRRSLLIFACPAQDFEATLKINSGVENSIFIEGKFLNENNIKPTKIGFSRVQLPGIEDLGERIT